MLAFKCIHGLLRAKDLHQHSGNKHYSGIVPEILQAILIFDPGWIVGLHIIYRDYFRRKTYYYRVFQ